MQIKAALLAALACGLFAQDAAAQAIPRIKARILSFEGKVLTVTSGTAGQSLTIGLLPSTHLMYEEKQDHFDPAKEIHRLEIDIGFVLIFGFNIYILALDNAVHCMKFLVMHDSDPVLDGKTKAGICKGNTIGIYGRGPHPGFKFMMRRIVGDDLESRIVSENDLDDDTKAYLAG